MNVNLILSNETIYEKCHETCKCKCRLDGSAFDNK